MFFSLCVCFPSILVAALFVSFLISLLHLQFSVSWCETQQHVSNSSSQTSFLRGLWWCGEISQLAWKLLESQLQLPPSLICLSIIWIQNTSPTLQNGLLSDYSDLPALCVMFPSGLTEHPGSREWIFTGGAESPGLLPALTSPHRQVELFLHFVLCYLTVSDTATHTLQYLLRYQYNLTSNHTAQMLLPTFNIQHVKVSHFVVLHVDKRFLWAKFILAPETNWSIIGYNLFIYLL